MDNAVDKDVVTPPTSSSKASTSSITNESSLLDVRSQVRHPIVKDEARPAVVKDKARNFAGTDAAETSIVGDRSGSPIVRDEARSTIVSNEARLPAVRDEAESAIVMDEAESAMVMDEAESAIVMDEAESAMVMDEAESAMVMDEAESAMVMDEAESAMVIDEARPLNVRDEDVTSVVKDEATSSIGGDGAKPSGVSDEAGPSSVNNQIGLATVSDEAGLVEMPKMSDVNDESVEVVAQQDSAIANSGGSSSIVKESSNQRPTLPHAQTEVSLADGTSKGKLTQNEAKLIRSSSSRVITFDTTHVRIEPSQIIEYEWPSKSGERYFIQEQIAELLDVKSFKRKYPELSRHTIEINEREHLFNNHSLSSVLSEHQMHGLTALRAVEVHELMASDYPGIYSEYQRAAADKIKFQMAEDQKRLDTIKLDAKRLEELRTNAIRSASEYNTELNSMKRTERRHFWDLQTSIIQSPRNIWKRLPPSATRPGPYPVALISGQYHQHYKKLSSDELYRLPLDTVLDYDHLIPPKRSPSPPPIRIHESEITHSPPEEEMETNEQDANALPVLQIADYISGNETPEQKQQISVAERRCSICKSNKSIPMLSCSKCRANVHPECAELPERVVQVALGYTWSCIECKNCTVCEKPDNEDAMMFCDRCDRGYHTFCVGLSTPPTGTWICTNFCSNLVADSHDVDLKNLKNDPDQKLPDSLLVQKKG